MQFRKGGRVKHGKKSATSEAIKSKELKSYNEMRDHFEKQKKSEQRKKDMEKDKQKIYEKKYGIAVKKGGIIRKRENPISRSKKNYRPTKSGAGMTKKGVAAYRRANPGSKLKTAVTGKVKPGSKAANRRKSYCARSLGQLKRSSAKTRNDPNSRIRQARRRWKC